MGLVGLGVSACRHDPANEPPPPTNPQPNSDASVVEADTGVVDTGAAPGPSVTDGWWRDSVFYEIFVRSFSDSNGDGVGDLAGLTERLDYLNDGDPNTNMDLGIDAVWLMPIMASPSYHGYDVTDYTAINPDYGSLEDFDTFLAEAHRRGIKVIIDFVLNHSSSQHPWFRQSRNPSSSFRTYYTWREQPDPRWQRPWDGANVWHSSPTGYYFGIFWSGMPDLNLANAEVEEKMHAAMRFWLARGVDGFRVDAVRYLLETEDGNLADIPETHAFVKRTRRALADFPEAVWVAEAWTDTARVAQYYGTAGDEFQLAFSFDVAGAIKSSINDGNRASFNQTLAEAARSFEDRGFEAPFLSNHDMQRVMRELRGDAAAMRVAAATLMALPGTPFLYYGEEIGMQGGATPRDEDKRTPMRWTANGPGFGFTNARVPWHPGDEDEGVDVESQRGRPGALWTLYRDLIALRHAHPALSDGTADQPSTANGGRGVVALLRTSGDRRVLFVANFHREAAPAFTVRVNGTPTVVMHEGLAGTVANQGESVRFEGLGPRGFAFVQL